MLVAEIAIFAYCIAQFIIHVVRDSDFYYYRVVCSNLPTLLLAVALAVAFRQLSKLNGRLGGVFCDDKLMVLHYSFFIAAAFCDVVLLSLDTALHEIKEADHNSTPRDT